MATPMVQKDLVTQRIAYEVLFNYLPSPWMWRHGLNRTSGGATEQGVRSAMRAIRCEVQSRIGQLAKGDPVSREWPCVNDGATSCEAEMALRFVMTCFPTGRLYGLDIRTRREGCSSEDVRHHLSGVYAMFHHLLSETRRPPAHLASRHQHVLG